MSNNGIGKLPVELHLCVLKQLSTVQDIYSLIRASPQHYRVFFSYKQDILSTVIGRMLGPEIFVDALAVVEASDPRYQNDDREIVLAFLRRYKDARDLNHLNQKVTPSTATAVCRLNHAVEYHIKDYTRRATAILTQCTKTASFVESERRPNSSTSCIWETEILSAVEKERLRRAFYRVELFEHLFRDCKKRAPEMKFSDEEKADLFLALFSSSQIEEIACIRDYLRLRMEEAYERASYGGDTRYISCAVS